ncbi:MAG: helix-turn-helix domain-containing protein [Hyphomicrobiaceae bacterium]|nr:helix-turn-helix domain-containing protein [Hyphomicrobiaceae bacterium]
MRAADAEYIRRVPLFRNMKDTSFETLVAAGYLQRFPDHVILLHEGEQPDFLHVIVEGAVEQFATHGDRETTLSIIGPPAALILAAVVLDRPYLTSARTLKPSLIVLIPAEAVRAVFDQDPAFARATIHEFANRYRAIVKDLKNMRLRPSIERLASWIFRANLDAGGTGRFLIPFEKRSLASQLGMRPENLSRNFAELARHGVKVNGREIRIEDADALERLARPDPLIDDPSV